MDKVIDMSLYRYELPPERIAKYPLPDRSSSKLLVYKDKEIINSHFRDLESYLPKGATLVFNNTKVISARLVFHKATGARIEILCLEPHSPRDYERMFASTDPCQWVVMVGNAKKWKGEKLKVEFTYKEESRGFNAELVSRVDDKFIVQFSWDGDDITFGQALEQLGRVPLPPYLERETEESDKERYQTVYSRYSGSVAAPTAGLHFTPEILSALKSNGHQMVEVTLHVGAGTFLPVKSSNAADHKMHIEHFGISLSSLETLERDLGNIIAVGTTSVRTIESLSVLGHRAMKREQDILSLPIGQWEAYDIADDIEPRELLSALISYCKERDITYINGSTQIMITPGYRFKVISGLGTNFHQPSSTLLLLISAIVGDSWREIYSFAMDNDYRFLSYGDSSLLMIDNETK